MKEEENILSFVPLVCPACPRAGLRAPPYKPEGGSFVIAPKGTIDRFSFLLIAENDSPWK